MVPTYSWTSDRDGESQNPTGCKYPDGQRDCTQTTDIVVVEDNKTALLIDIAVPGDTRVEEE